jgi:hypothetical protein
MAHIYLFFLPLVCGRRGFGRVHIPILFGLDMLQVWTQEVVLLTLQTGVLLCSRLLLNCFPTTCRYIPPIRRPEARKNKYFPTNIDVQLPEMVPSTRRWTSIVWGAEASSWKNDVVSHGVACGQSHHFRHTCRPHS